MFKQTPVVAGVLLALSGVTTLVSAQTTLERVEVTGSSIKRVDAETSVPVTVIKADDLKKAGIATIEQAMALIGGNQSSQGTSQSVGSATGGAAFANMRGLGQNKTLVLLNGRRIANNAFDGSAPDLNMIPFAALQRVEVLRDGASSLYGTDAVGGVINFITRKDMQGGTISLGYDSPQHDGGKSKSGNIGFGFGDLSRDKFNVMGFIDLQKQDQLKASQRDFGSTGYIPSMGLTKSSGNAFPGNYKYYDKTGAYAGVTNPAAPTCKTDFTFTLDGSTCRYDYTKWVDLVPETERRSGLLKGTIAVNNDTQVNLEYFASSNVVKTKIAPVPFAGLTVNAGTKYYPGMGITPGNTDATWDPTKAISVNWRDVPNGPRADKNENVQQRFIASIEGALAGWDYNAAYSFNQNKVDQYLTGGYADGAKIRAGIADGTINPFGAQDAAGQTALDAALLSGHLLTGKATVHSVDAHASHELADWFHAGSPVMVAVGAEFRREEMTFKAADTAYATAVVDSTGIDPGTNNNGSRNVSAVFAELNVPLLKTLELTAAIRADKYSDFGSTVNPKVSLRFQPSRELLLRGSYTTGFRAPSLYDLYAPQTYTNTANNYDDPVNCVNGKGVNGFATPDVCNTQFMALTGGNTKLRAETSKGLTLGVMVSPVANFTAGLDFWWIRLEHQIGGLAQDAIFADPTKYASLFHRTTGNGLSISGADCPGTNCGYVSDTSSNLGGVNTNGVDLTMNYRLKAAGAGTFDVNFTGTYVSKYDYQLEEGGVWFNNVGIYSNGSPVFRWQHTLNLGWNLGDFSAGLTNRYRSGYFDQNNVAAPHDQNKVGSYTLWDIYGGWAATKAINLTVGVRNLLDSKPPFSNQGATFQQGYDPRYTDSLGRTYYVRASYGF